MTRSDKNVMVWFRIEKFVFERDEPILLHVRIENDSDTPVSFMDFPSDAGFVHFYVCFDDVGPFGDLPSKEGGAERLPLEKQPCAIEPWPGVASSIDGHASHVRTIDLREFLTVRPLPLGVYEPVIRWDRAQEDLASHREGSHRLPASQIGHNWTRIHVVEGPTLFRIARGESRMLDGVTELRFDAHGHKHTYADGPPSPLLLHLGVKEAGDADFEELSLHLHMEETRQFAVRGHAFELRDHHYDRWMDLAHYGKLE